MSEKIKAALLVDADNLPVKQAEEALEKLAEICNPVIKKAFGDFAGSAKNWSPEFLRKHGFTPVMHFAVSKQKNGADIAMTIAAMDIIYARTVDAIVLFTSDSDFASLAARIREAGLEAVGVGDSKASQILRGAFDKFVVVEMPKKAAAQAVAPALKPKPVTPKAISSDTFSQTAIAKKPAAKKTGHVANANVEKKKALPSKAKTPIKKTSNSSIEPPSKVVPLVIKAMKKLGSQGRAHRLSELCVAIVSDNSNFSATHYGCSDFRALLEKTGQFAVHKDGTVHRAQIGKA